MNALQFQTIEGKNCTNEVLEKIKIACPEVFDNIVLADIFPPSGGGPQAMSAQFQIPYWGTLPLDPDLLQCCESGKTFVDEHPTSLAARSLQQFCERITTQLKVDEVS